MVIDRLRKIDELLTGKYAFSYLAGDILCSHMTLIENKKRSISSYL